MHSYLVGLKVLRSEALSTSSFIHCSYEHQKLVAHSVTCLATYAYLTADPGVAITIPARSHSFKEIDHVIISTSFSLPLNHSRRVVVSYERKYVHEVLVNCLFKLAQ